MKIYIFYIDQVVDFDHLTQKAEPHLTKESALIRFNEFVEDEKKYVERDGWHVENDEEDHFQAYVDGSYPENHVDVRIMEEELQDLKSSNIIVKSTHPVFDTSSPFYGKQQISSIDIFRWEHNLFKDVTKPNGDVLVVSLEHDKVRYDFEIDMEHFTLEPTGYEGKSSSSVYVKDGINNASGFEVSVYTDENNDIWHVDCIWFEDVENDDTGDKIKLTLKRGEDDVNWFKVEG